MTESLIGIGLRPPHIPELLVEKPDIGWLEVHSENYLSAAGTHIDALLKIRDIYKLSLHGVGLSLGSAHGLNSHHLEKLKILIDKTKPIFVSEHLSWNVTALGHMPDLLPIPYTKAMLKIFAENVNKAQDFLGQKILIENPSSYVEYGLSQMSEADFLAELQSLTGCGILLDVNNVYVSCVNHGWSAQKYLRTICTSGVAEIHLGGHSEYLLNDKSMLLIDSHDSPIAEPVWELYAATINLLGALPTLIEWDANIPDLATLLKEANKADEYLQIHSGYDVAA